MEAKKSGNLSGRVTENSTSLSPGNKFVSLQFLCELIDQLPDIASTSMSFSSVDVGSSKFVLGK
jgi:hypothetical protein